MAVGDRKPQGFSLIEVMFAVILLTVVVFGVIRLHTRLLSLGQVKTAEVQAYFLAQEGVKTAEALGKDALNEACIAKVCQCYLNPQGADVSLVCPGESEREEGEAVDGFLRYIFLRGNALLNDAFIATARVEWQDSNGIHTVEEKRLIYQ